MFYNPQNNFGGKKEAKVSCTLNSRYFHYCASDYLNNMGCAKGLSGVNELVLQNLQFVD